MLAVVAHQVGGHRLGVHLGLVVVQFHLPEGVGVVAVVEGQRAEPVVLLAANLHLAYVQQDVLVPEPVLPEVLVDLHDVVHLADVVVPDRTRHQDRFLG